MQTQTPARRFAGALMRRMAALELAAASLSACAAIGVDSADTAVCRTVAQQRSVLAHLLKARPRKAGPIDAALATVLRALEVRDTDASDRKRGDALVLQLNLAQTRKDLGRCGPLPAPQVGEAFTTFARRECP